MSFTEQIRLRLTEALTPEHIELINESHKHAGHAGDNGSGNSHYKLIVVSAVFEGCSRIQRHRMVYNVVNSEFSNNLHALAIQAYTPAEYATK